MEESSAQPPQPPAENDQELEDIKKEMHMSGRAMRIDETLEEYKAEREKSWAEKQARAAKPEDTTESVITNTEEKPPLSAGEQKINEYVDRILGGESKDSIFQGLPDSFKSRIDSKLAEKAKIEKRRKADEEKLAEIRASLGLEPVAASNPEDSEKMEKYKKLRDQMEQVIKYAWKVAQEGEKDKSGNWIRRPVDFMRFLKTGAFAQTMYDSIHSQNGPSWQEMTEKYIDNPNFSNFENTISDKLVSAVTSTSNVRYITPEELIARNKPGQAIHFVWFAGNSLRPANAREVRFYVSARPEGVVDVATNLAKISDICDENGLRLQFKFRRELYNYYRSDTCVAYLYIPEAKDAVQQKNSDDWIKYVARGMSNIPNKALRSNVSLFTEKFADGIAFVEDSRSKDSKDGESYTSQIANTMGRVALEYGKRGENATPDILPEIVNVSLERLKKIGY